MAPPSEIRVISDPETLRLITDPLRLRMLELLRQRSRTVTELAELLDVPRTKLYYHVRLLEEHELVAVDKTRVVSGITERHFRATAYRLSVDKSLLGTASGAGSPLELFLSVVLDEAASDILRAVDAGLIDLGRTREDTIRQRSLLLGRTWFRFTEKDLREFSERYDALIAEFADRAVFEPTCGNPDGEEREGDLYEWLMGFYPVLPPSSDDDD